LIKVIKEGLKEQKPSLNEEIEKKENLKRTF
jgi:hypothetical protein